MTQDEIIEMAIKSHLVMANYSHPTLLDFAKLVAQKERERIKQTNAPEIERINAHIKQLEDAVLAEREACAQVAQDESDWNGDVPFIADLIRARGQA